jgi:hypothetical protein
VGARLLRQRLLHQDGAQVGPRCVAMLDCRGSEV